MGMFDYVICLYPLSDYPDAAPRDGFQTKSLGKGCNEYTIYSNGKLTLTKFGWATVNNRSEQVNVNEPLYYTGTLNFYEEYKDIWYEYDAEFVDGKLTLVNRIPETGLENR